jgi:hypothetical protein
MNAEWWLISWASKRQPQTASKGSGHRNLALHYHTASKGQPVAATSSTESEFYAVSQCAVVCVYLQGA